MSRVPAMERAPAMERIPAMERAPAMERPLAMTRNCAMRRVRAVGAGAVALACATACVRTPPAVTPMPGWPPSFSFVASSPTDSAMQGTFEGTAQLANGWITVTVPRGVITVPPGNSENWRNLTIRAFLATDYMPDNWKAVAQSRPVNVFRFINFGSRWTERRTLPIEQQLTFQVPIPAGARPQSSRLAFELEWVFVMGAFGDTDSRIAFSGPIPPP